MEEDLFDDIQSQPEIVKEEVSKNIELSEEQKGAILVEWNRRKEVPPSIAELIRLCFGKELDPRTKEGRAIRAFLAAKQIKVQKPSEYVPKGLLPLTNEQKEYISNNCQTMKVAEIAEVLFQKRGLTNLSQETRTVIDYVKILPNKVVYDAPAIRDVPEGGYQPPKAISRMIARINKYVHEGLNEEKLTSREKKNCISLIGYLHTFRFVHQINSYETESERELFESSFIKYTYDKGDLSSEDVDQYIILGTEIVMDFNIQKTINMLQREQDTLINEGQRMSPVLIEAINVARTEYNSCVKRQQALYKALTEERSKRIGGKLRENATVLNLVNEWKEEDKRKEYLHNGNLRKEALKDAIKKYSSMEEIKARIMGISEEEVLNG